MKKLVRASQAFILIQFWSLTTIAQPVELLDVKSKVVACQSINSQIPTGIMTLTENKHMTEFKVGDQVVWAVNLETETSTVDTIQLKDLNPKQFPLIKSMVQLAGAKKIKDIQAIKLSMVSKKNGQDLSETLSERIARVSSESTSYIYLEALNSKNKTVGNSAMAAWAGLFKNCR